MPAFARGDKGREGGMSDNLFVYGTLRAEFPHPLARRLQETARLIGRASTPGTLYDFGRYPGAMFDAKARSRVIGEVFALARSDALWTELDAYESVVDPGTPPYRRVAIEVRLDHGGTIGAWTYELTEPPAAARRIPGGDYMQHFKTKCGRPLRP
jgi:gamma-glutamylcyclotransferase (GGCT)/AIG2-like uncharacterized protein YtfP